MASEFVYNLSIKVSWAIAEEWLQWQKSTHIPEIMDTGQFAGYSVYQLQDVEDIEGPTYIIQYFAASEQAFQIYQSEYAAGLALKAFEKWGDQFIAYRTTMRLVH